MGLEAYQSSTRAQKVFEVGSNITKLDLVEVCFGETAAELDKTEIAQPAISAASLGEFLYLEELGLRPDAGEGHSMGEIPLLAMAEVITLESMFMLIKARAAATAKANTLRPGMMARVRGLSKEQIEEELSELFESGRLTLTNFNARLQHMISGDEDLVKQAIETIKRKAGLVADMKGARISRSRIQGAFHSPYHMQPAKQSFNKTASYIRYSNPKFDVILNNGLYLEELGLSNLPDYLVGQLVGSVLFSESTKRLIDDGISNFIQVGDRPVLTDLIKEDYPEGVNIIKIQKVNGEKDKPES